MSTPVVMPSFAQATQVEFRPLRRLARRVTMVSLGPAISGDAGIEL